MALIVLSLFLIQCTKNKQAAATSTPLITMTPETDSALFAKITTNTGFHYYKNNDWIYHSAPASAHKAFFRVHFNDIAQNALTDNGKLPSGATFPVGSLIVKELHGNALGTKLQCYAIMEKLPDDANSAYK